MLLVIVIGFVVCLIVLVILGFDREYEWFIEENGVF